MRLSREPCRDASMDRREEGGRFRAGVFAGEGTRERRAEEAGRDDVDVGRVDADDIDDDARDANAVSRAMTGVVSDKHQLQQYIHTATVKYTYELRIQVHVRHVK